jgi:hypothetical protein
MTQVPGTLESLYLENFFRAVTKLPHELMN